MTWKNLVTGLLLCSGLHVPYAAAREYEGIVNDECGQPLEFASVALLATEDSTFVAGVVTDANGRFTLSDSGKDVFLRVSAMGYEERIIHDPHAARVIVLVPASYMLGEVEVRGSRPVARLKGDGVQVDVADTYLADTGTALDLLGKMPFVTKSASGLEILGRGAPVVYVNGRQVRDQSELDQLASSQVRSVDVVTNPGAKYASTVNAVIRITTVSPVGEGFSLNDRTTLGSKHYSYVFQQVNLNYRRNGFDLFGMLNYENYRERTGAITTTTRYLKSGTVVQNSQSTGLSKYPVYHGKIGMNYSVKQHNMGFFYDFSFTPSISIGTSATLRYMDDLFSEALSDDSHTSAHNRQHLLSAYYSGTINSLQLSANFDAIWQINDSRSREYEVSSANPLRNFVTVNNVVNLMFAGNVIASLPVWKGSLRFGTEVSAICRTDLYTGSADYITDNDISIDETVMALFAETEQTFGPVITGVGLRWEYTDSRYLQFGELSPDQSRKYHNLAPTASLSFPLGNVRGNVSYTRKTTRPAFAQLSSAVRYLDRYSYEAGNPNLKPIYRDYLAASASWKDFVLELEFTSTKNYFMWQTAQYPANPAATLLTMVNMPRFETYGVFLNYSPTFFGIWHPSLMAGVELQNFRIYHHGSTLILNRPLGITRLNNALHLPLDIWLNLDFSARTAGNGENLYIWEYWQCDLGLYKSFAGDTWSVKLHLNDLFGTWRQEFTSYDALSRISTRKIRDTRDLSLTVRYNFNTARTRYSGRGAGNAEKDRL